MSVEASKWVINNSPYEGGFFTIHLIMADTVNEAHENKLWLKEETLVWKSRTSPSTVRRAKVRMIADGLLELINDSHGPGKADSYRFLMPQTQITMTPVRTQTQITMTPEHRSPCSEHRSPCSVFSISSIYIKNPSKHKLIPSENLEDPVTDIFGKIIPKAQPLPISDVPAVDIPAPKSLTPIEGKATKTRKPDLLFEAIAEVCGINWRDTTRSELGQVRKARSELGNTADGTPDEVRRKAVIYHRMFPNMTLTPMALVKHWSRLEEKNILKTSAELKNEHLERTFASYNIPVMAQEATNGSTNDHGSSDVSSDSSSDAMETAFPSDSTPGTSRRDAIVESQASKHADTSSPRSPAMGRQNAPDTDSGRRLGFEHGFQPNGSQNTSNRSTAPLTGKSEVPPESLPPNGSLSYVNRVEPQVVLTSERPSDLVLDADAERRRIAAKSLISEFAKQKQMADPKSSARRTSVPDGPTVVYEDEPLPEYHGSYEDEDMQDYQEESRW